MRDASIWPACMQQQQPPPPACACPHAAAALVCRETAAHADADAPLLLQSLCVGRSVGTREREREAYNLFANHSSLIIIIIRAKSSRIYS